jgi:hypothetical protein
MATKPSTARRKFLTYARGRGSGCCRHRRFENARAENSESASRALEGLSIERARAKLLSYGQGIGEEAACY